ncbi:hypothetical protein C7447_102557 [Tenacibaculum adriaticum]|uniref:Uncharacterized protein n=1 Tax=Tenacibaculum adriaticum TaxID=413713 RepID=A0A5S5DTY6_9FLAO|nr:hypothetical protein [Tenacibaculum adriaticum]TYP99235.1 hypothetical protein C7447_102557 [Tenacibaculum adriaticum]
MRNITANAILNLKEQPASLYVHGSIMTYRADDIIEVAVASPLGISPSILVLDLIVKSGNGPMKGTPKPFNYELSDDSAKNYSQVTIRYSEDASVTVNIEVFG